MCVCIRYAYKHQHTTLSNLFLNTLTICSHLEEGKLNDKVINFPLLELLKHKLNSLNGDLSEILKWKRMVVGTM